MAYPGRTVQEPETLNFGGLNLKATLLNLRDGEAQDITNFDIDISGSLTTRLGYQILTSVSGPIEYYNNYFTATGQEVFVIIANHKFYESTSISGPFIDRTGSMVLTGTEWQGTYIADSFVIGNGVEAPFISILGSNIATIESLSYVNPPTDLTISQVGTAGAVTVFYAVTSVTARGESLISVPAFTTTSNASLTTTDYNQIAWVGALGAQSYNVYKYSGTLYEFLSNTIATSFSDTGQTVTVTNPPTSSTAVNTPNDWNLNGQPEGFAVLARGRNQHLIAWRKNTVWAAAYGSAIDWFSTNDAFGWVVQGGEDNSIKVVVTLFDFTVFFSSTNAFVYTGSTPTDLVQNKILHTGCTSPYSVVPVGDDIYIWSNFGPTTLSRILQGADIQMTSMSVKVNPLVFEQTNRSSWNQISGWHDIRNQRVCWAYPSTESSSNDHVLLWGYTIVQPDGTKGAWTKFDTWEVVNATTSASTSNVYGVMLNGDVVKLHFGTVDGWGGVGAGTSITSTYKSAWYDLRTWIKKRMLWLDLVMDASYNYYVNAKTAWEFNRIGMDQTHVVTNNTTDGYQIETLGDYNQHRVYTQGDGKHFQYTFTCSSPCRIIAWRAEARLKGIR